MTGTQSILTAAFAALVLLTPSGAGAQQAIFLVRHAEQSPPPELVLTEAGHRRATALAHRLRDAGITAIFTSDAARTRQTAAPTAKALGIEPKVVPMREVEELVRRVRAEHPQDRVLIVNHSLNIPAILKALGHPEEVRVALDDYEPLIVIIPQSGGPPTVVRLRL